MVSSAPTATANGTITFSLILVTLAVCLGTTFNYYTNSVISNLVELGQHFMNQSSHDHYGYYLTKSQMIVLWSFSSVAFPVGSLLGCMVTRLLGDNYGRRVGLIILSVVTMIGSVCCGLAELSNCLEMFIVGRLLMGIALGSGLPLASMFLTEIAPVRYRGACASTLQVIGGFSNVVANGLTLTPVLGNSWGWKFAVSVPPFIGALVEFVVLTFYAHDSPRELMLTRNDPKPALAAIQFYQGEEGAEDEVLAIKKERRVLQGGNDATTFRFWDLFRKEEIRRPLGIALMLVFCTHMTGTSAVMSYSKTMFHQAGLDGTTSQYATIGLGLCSGLSPFITMCLVDRMGRKPIYLGAMLIAVSAQVSLTACLFGSTGYHWPGAAMGAIPCMYLLMFGFSIANSIAAIVPVELFPQHVRASAMTVVSIFLCSLLVVIVMGYLPFAALVGVRYSYTPFIVSMTLSMVILIKYMPETKRKTVEQVAAMFVSRHNINGNE